MLLILSGGPTFMGHTNLVLIDPGISEEIRGYTHIICFIYINDDIILHFCAL